MNDYWSLSGGTATSSNLIKHLFTDITSDNVFEIPPYVDWENVPIDTRVWVSDDEECWKERYFYRYEEDEEFPFIVFVYGATSLSTSLTMPFKYCKLAESEE